MILAHKTNWERRERKLQKINNRKYRKKKIASVIHRKRSCSFRGKRRSRKKVEAEIFFFFFEVVSITLYFIVLLLLLSIILCFSVVTSSIFGMTLQCISKSLFVQSQSSFLGIFNTRFLTRC